METIISTSWFLKELTHVEKSPWFDHYKIILNESTVLISKSNEIKIPIPIQLGNNIIEITPINDCEVHGQTARLHVEIVEQ